MKDIWVSVYGYGKTKNRSVLVLDRNLRGLRVIGPPKEVEINGIDGAVEVVISGREQVYEGLAVLYAPNQVDVDGINLTVAVCVSGNEHKLAPPDGLGILPERFG